MHILERINSQNRGHIYREHEIRQTRQEKAAELEERLEDVMRQGQKELQETKTKHKRELAKVSFAIIR